MEEEDIKENGKVVIKGMNNNYSQQMEKMRKEMFAWYKVRLLNEEKAMVVKTHRLSKFTHVAMILEDPPKKLIEEIEGMICRFIQAGNYKTTKELVFLPNEHGGLGIPRLKEFWIALRVGWMKRTFQNQSFWLRLLTENSNIKTPPTYWTHKQREEAFSSEQNPFWKKTLSSWKK